MVNYWGVFGATVQMWGIKSHQVWVTARKLIYLSGKRGWMWLSWISTADLAQARHPFLYPYLFWTLCLSSMLTLITLNMDDIWILNVYILVLYLDLMLLWYSFYFVCLVTRMAADSHHASHYLALRLVIGRVPMLFLLKLSCLAKAATALPMLEKQLVCRLNITAMAMLPYVSLPVAFHIVY